MERYCQYLNQNESRICCIHQKQNSKKSQGAGKSRSQLATLRDQTFSRASKKGESTGSQARAECPFVDGINSDHCTCDDLICLTSPVTPPPLLTKFSAGRLAPLGGRVPRREHHAQCVSRLHTFPFLAAAPIGW